jgi:hypothetical protein
MSDFSAWCRDLKSEKWVQDSEISILESYLTESISASEAAEKFTKYTDRSSTAESKVGRLWTLILLCADENPDAHEALVELLRAVVGVSASKETGGVDWTSEEQRTRFKETWRDSYDCGFSSPVE